MSVFKKIQASNLQFYYGLDLEKATNVTEIVLQNCVQPDGSIIVDQNKNSLFGDPFPNIVKSFFCVYESKVIRTYNENEPIHLLKDEIYFERNNSIIPLQYKSNVLFKFERLWELPSNFAIYYGESIEKAVDIYKIVLNQYSGEDGIHIPFGTKFDTQDQNKNFYFLLLDSRLFTVDGEGSISIGTKISKPNIIIQYIYFFNR